MTPADQLESWVRGISLHNQERDECCPDFSCCRPALQAPEDERQRFYEAWKAGRTDVIDGMLMLYLGAMVADEGETPHIAGQNHE